MSKQSDIARRFDLPERQSKLNTMLREEGLRDEQVYCICRSSDVSRFMIGCDHCEEWYHGDCINVTENEANKIRKFFCEGCRLKQPTLEIKYKEKRSHHHMHHREKDKHSDEKKHSHEKHSSSKIKSEKRKDRCGECEACYIREDCGRCEYCKEMPKFGGTGNLKQRCKKRQCQNFYHLAKKHRGTSSTKSDKRVDSSRNDHSYNSHAANSSNSHAVNSSNSHAANSSKLLTQLISDSKSESAVTQFSIPVTRLDEKTIKSHSTSSGVCTTNITTAKPSSNVSLKPSSSLDSKHSNSLHTKSSNNLSVKPSSNLHMKSNSSMPMKSVSGLNVKHSSNLPGKHNNILPITKSNIVSSETIKVLCENADNMLASRPEKPLPTILTNVTNHTTVDDLEEKRKWEKDSGLVMKEHSDHNSDEERASKSLKMWGQSVFKPYKQRKRKDQVVSRKRKPQRDSDSDLDNWNIEIQVPRQCLGPQCIKAARSGSKYCGDDCGLELARARIYSVLPQRIQEWNMTPCKAEENDRKNLEKIRNQQLDARKALQLLDEKHKELDRLLERTKAVSIDPQADDDEEADGTEGAFVYCVTCGHEIPSRRAIKHMHNCYNKLESQMSFGSMFKTRIEGNNMFCDYFNPANHTYCKRLRVMCPEHTKDPKVSNTEVCGFPLTEDIFTETNSVCRVSKKKCIRHYCWEKLRRACVDMERVQQCLKLDELVEQERQFRLSITNRAGVLGLMLHSTYDHEYAVKLAHQQHRHADQLQQQQQQEKLKNNSSSDHLNPSKNRQLSSSKDHQYPFKKATSNLNEEIAYVSDHHYHRLDSSTGTSESSKYAVKNKTHSKITTSTKVPTNIPSGRTHEHSFPPVDTSRNGNWGNIPSVGTTAHHDHGYFSSQQARHPDNKKLQDHLYYSNKKHK